MKSEIINWHWKAFIAATIAGLLIWPLIMSRSVCLGALSFAAYMGQVLWQLGGWTWLSFVPMIGYCGWAAYQLAQGRELCPQHLAWLHFLDYMPYGVGIVGVIQGIKTAGVSGKGNLNALLGALGPLEIAVILWLIVQTLLWWNSYPKTQEPELNKNYAPADDICPIDAASE